MESALVADTILASRVRELAAIRELVAGLGRPALAHDLAPEILQRIGGLKPSSFAWVGGRGLPKMRLRVAGLSLAASVLLALTLAVLSNQPGGPQLANAPVDAIQPRPVALPIARDAVPEIRPTVLVADQPKAASVPVAAKRNEPVVLDDVRLRARLDSPRLTRVIIVRNSSSSRPVDRRICEMLEATPRVDAAFGRIEVAPGLTIDPDFPDAAKVFVVALHDDELIQLRKELLVAFPGAVEERLPDAAVVTQLAEIGEFVILPGTRVTPVEPVSADGAQLAHKTANEDVTEPVTEAATLTPERLNSAPSPHNKRIRRVDPPNSDPEETALRNAAEESQEKAVHAPEKSRSGPASNLSPAAVNTRKEPAIVLIVVGGEAR